MYVCSSGNEKAIIFSPNSTAVSNARTVEITKGPDFKVLPPGKKLFFVLFTILTSIPTLCICFWTL